jgi:peptide/nickel transport system permease protein
MTVLRRLVSMLAVLFAVVSLAFAVEELLPGDPARMAAGVQARPADVARVREQLGLDRPPLTRYALFWRRLVHVGPAGSDLRAIPGHQSCAVVVRFGDRALHVDLGRSFQLRRPVVDLVAARFPRTVELAAAGLFAQLFVGFVAGTVAATRRGSWIDRALVGAGVLGISIPTFVVALALQILFARELGWLPIDGYGATPLEHARSLVLPALTLGIYGSMFYTRLVRDDVSQLLASDWMRTAYAKGASRTRAVVVHALRNALGPIVTAAALDFGALMGGTIVTEAVFRWPGLGQLSLVATQNRDGPVVCGCLVVTAAAVVVANAAADVVLRRIDPRTAEGRPEPRAPQ